MQRVHATAAGLLAWLLLTPVALAQQGPLDLVPDDAAFGLVVRSIADVRDKGEKFFEDNDVDPNKAPRPATLFKDLLKNLNIKDGLDEKGSVALVLPNLKKLGIEKIDPNNFASIIDVLMSLVLVIPVEDMDKMAGNFDLKKGDLESGKLVGDAPNHYLLARDKHLLYGFKEKSVRLVAERRPLSKALSPAQAKALAGSDVALHFGTDAWGKVYRGLLDDLLKLLQLGEGKADNEVIEQFVEALRSEERRVGKECRSRWSADD